MEKIRFQSPDGTVEDFYIEEQTRIGGVAYLLVSDSMDDEANAYIKSGDMVGTALQKIQIPKPAMKWLKMRTNCRQYIKFLSRCLRT